MVPLCSSVICEGKPLPPKGYFSSTLTIVRYLDPFSTGCPHLSERLSLLPEM